MTVQEVIALRLAILRGGYVPLPLYGKVPPAFGKNNARGGLGQWQKIEIVSYDQIKMWSKTWPDAFNTGILTKLTPTLDADILDETAAIAVEDLVREFYEESGRVLVRIGKPPKRAFPFRTEEPFSKIVVNFVARTGAAQEKLEFLASGQQVAVAGAHPETHGDYRWFGGDLVTTPHEELPYIRESDARDLVARAADMLTREFGYVRAADRPRKAAPKSNGAEVSGGSADWQYLFDRIHAGEALHDSLRDLAAKMITSGMKPGAVVNILRAQMESSNAPRDDRWRARISEIPRLVNGAEKFRTDQIGGQPSDSLGDVASAATQQQSALGEWDAGEDTSLPPPRCWLLGKTFARKFLSAVFGDGAVGKTALRYAQALSLATGRSLTGEYLFQRARVLILSLEDDADELRRRVLAVCLHFGIRREEIAGWLFLASPGSAVGKLMATDRRGSTIRGTLAGHLEAVISIRKIDLIMIDPFVKAHSVEENLNSAIDDVAQLLTNVAAEHNIAVDVLHHTSKGTSDPGNAQRGRGASALVNACRLVCTISQMTEDEARAFNIAAQDRRQYVRVDPAKVNIAPSAGDATWFRLVSVALDNGTELYPSGDHVQTVEPWRPPETWAYLTVNLLNEILTAIDAGTGDGNYFTDAAKAPRREAWCVVQRFASAKSEEQCRNIIKTWVKTGVLVPFEYENPLTRKNVRGLRVDPVKRPS